jgi:hypothetical protein
MGLTRILSLNVEGHHLEIFTAPWGRLVMHHDGVLAYDVKKAWSKRDAQVSGRGRARTT